MLKFKYKIREDENVSNIDAWVPKTTIGKMVKNKEITSIEQIFALGKPIKEVEIIDSLMQIHSDVIEVASVQRMTKNNRRQKYRVTAVVGDMNGHVGVGTAKDVEVKPAIASAIKNAKLKMIPVRFGCGSWECSCGTPHSLPIRVHGRCGSSEVILKPAPRGVGIVANKVVKSVLVHAGLKDIWSFSRGRTRDIYNTAMATYEALEEVNNMKNNELLQVKS
jgi:small subunit ribosomal protein S5